VAVADALVVHVPPPVSSVSGCVAPVHTESVPVIADGIGFTVNGSVTKHVVGSVYVMTAEPAATPDTTPKGSMDAKAEALQDHVPNKVASLSVVVKPSQTSGVPSIIVGNGSIVTVRVEVQPEG